ncbi:TPA: hypothetical protein N0F65_002461 [Lagenidium giganteum]|uniref:Uncharacterized protein n=1 Tax=Lagenidium giganteum TaxID=4803 RepID=A0AAV2YQK2_9STRA|nr:TPA: hypothetical protein N0F65_002461 [Lagenidium giganteum]
MHPLQPASAVPIYVSITPSKTCVCFDGKRNPVARCKSHSKNCTRS